MNRAIAYGGSLFERRASTDAGGRATVPARIDLTAARGRPVCSVRAAHAVRRAARASSARATRPVVYDLGGSKAEPYQRMIRHWTEEMASVIIAAATSATDLVGAFRGGLVASFRFAADHTEILREAVVLRSGDTAALG